MNNVQTLGRLLATACALAAATFSTDSSAANVGIYGNCSATADTIVVAAGHTPVAVSSLSASSLNGLAALFDNTCGYSSNAAVDAAVANGMTLIVHDWSVAQQSQLPGHPAVSAVQSSGTDLEFPAGSPIASGVAGTLNGSSLDGGNWSYHGYVHAASLPAGSQALLTTPTPSHVVTFEYGYGRGRVIYSAIPLTWYFPGGAGASGVAGPGMRAYAANLIGWAAGPSFTTCAAEGYRGGQLTMCQKICESNLTGSALSGLIKLYVAAYREQPACSR
ncbi:MAG TPA: hypothetical protein VIG54_11105 [Lysobacter sp.]